MPITEHELQALIHTEITDAETFVDSVMGAERAESLKYYKGHKLGTEEEGRSSIVSREVRDAVQSMMPSLMRVFFGSERAVEFVPTGPEDVQHAEQATDLVNHIILRENPGFEVFFETFKDSLYQKNGVIKYWRDESVEVTYHEFTDLTDEGLGLVANDPGVEIVELESSFADDALEIALLAGASPPQLHNVTVKRTRIDPKIRIMSVPPEEFLIDRRARDIDTAKYVGHRALLTVNELVALGHPRELVLQHVSSSDALGRTHEITERYKDHGGFWPEDSKNEDQRKVLYVESYIRVDVDADGYAELRKFCSIGENHKIINGEGEPVTQRPFASFCPDPEPHLFFGQDLADQTKDLQLIATSIKRNMLDSLALSIYPRMAVLEGQANMDDVLNTEIGAIVREYQVGAVRPLELPFVGKEAIPILEIIEREKDRRVGTHDIALDAEALQSTTKAAVNAQVDSARQHLELVARIYAEGGMTRLFSGILKLVVANADRKLTVRLRNDFVEMDPREWNANMDVSVNVGLGMGLQEDRLRSLQLIAQFQREIVANMGPNNPLVSLGQISNTMSKIAELSGWKDSSQFVTKLPNDFQLPLPPPKPDPAELLAQTEIQKKQADMMIDGARLNLDRDEALADVLLRAEEIEARNPGTKVDLDRIRDAIEADRLTRT